MSVTSRIDGCTGKMYSFCAMYSLRMSFCSVPPRRCSGTPCSSATPKYMARRIGAGELMVIEVVTSPTSMPWNSVSMSSSESIATPQRPTSPSACGESKSRPMSVGMSNATESPVWPCSSRKR